MGEEGGGGEPVSQTVLSTFPSQDLSKLANGPLTARQSLHQASHRWHTASESRGSQKALAASPFSPGTITSSGRRQVGSHASGFSDILSASRHREARYWGFGTGEQPQPQVRTWQMKGARGLGEGQGVKLSC